VTDILLLVIDHQNGTYSIADHGERIVLQSVSLPEIIDFLENRDASLYSPGDAWQEAWDQAHPPPEAPVDLKIIDPTVLAVETDPATGLLTVRHSETREILAERVTVAQFVQALGRL